MTERTYYEQSYYFQSMRERAKRVISSGQKTRSFSNRACGRARYIYTQSCTGPIYKKCRYGHA